MGSALALVPPRSSVLLPGAGNKAEKANKTEPKGAKNAEERYVIESAVLNGDLHAPTVRRDGDGDVATIPAVEQTQCSLLSTAI